MSKVNVTVINPSVKDDGIKLMYEMEPCEICQVVENVSDYFGNYVIRTSNFDKFEVMNLTRLAKNRCWDEASKLKVKPVPVGTKIILEVTE